mmetsp:Transcript_1850/g.2263  ORF Transcript_1850/g.2263 Transcript_1850/m.2263 type:complete len:173 (-) Transcript_1850:80-598(-)
MPDTHNFQPTMKKALLFTVGLSAVLMTTVSCKKNCNIPEEDTFSGPIITEVGDQKIIIYPASGGLLGSFPNGMHITANSPQTQQDWFEVSFDGGVTRQALDFNQYNIIGYGLQVKCDASIDRALTTNPMANSALYTMTVQECNDGCDELRSLENYILVDDSMANYSIAFQVQ